MVDTSSIKLTQTIVNAAEPRTARYDIWDRDLSGFGLRVEKSGSKSFIIRYRAEGGGRSAPRRFMTVGKYGTLTADQARTQAKKLLGAAAKGDDPAGERRAHRKEMTVNALLKLYEEQGLGHVKDRTRRFTLARLKHHVVPLLGHKKIGDVRVADVERFIRDVRLGRTKKDEKAGPRARIIVSGGDGAAGKVSRDLSAMFSFAVRLELIVSNPCFAARKPPDGKRHRYLTVAEVQRLGEAVDELAANGANPKGIVIVRLLALTGCRREEIAALRWSEIDLDASCLILEDTKTGRSYRPLSPVALDLLKSVPRTSSPYVFPAERGDGHFQGLKKLWPDILKRAKLPGVTPHTLRHTFGSMAASSGETLLMVGALLGHANQHSSALYAHLQNSPALASAKRVATRIADAMSGLAPDDKLSGRGGPVSTRDDRVRDQPGANDSQIADDHDDIEDI